ncbi:hypothetical protein ABIF96_005777 [Bradyrhizobium ottawaense]|uniref:hypothetical protein n=1 Tax=Bradyrhizobium ottawaense TaxID=931866 RepID=UPI0038323FD8
MTSIIHDFRSIRRKLERQEQKAEFEEKNPKVEPSMYGWPYGVAVPFDLASFQVEAEGWETVESEAVWLAKI